MAKKRNKKNNKKQNKKKFNFKRFFAFVLFVYIIFSLTNYILNMPIKNIYVINNNMLSDQDIIEIAKIQYYPSSVTNTSGSIERRLRNDQYIKDAKVSKRWLFEVEIDVLENRPLVSYDDNVYLLDKTTVSDNHNVPTLINVTPNHIFEVFLNKMALVDQDILIRISEIQYKPNEVDDSLFFLTMTDGNYVYLTLNNYDIINEYINIIKNFENERGILYLDSGEYFEVLSN